MLTIVGVNPSWLVGWESSRVYEQTRQMIRVTCRCKRLRGGKHIVNGHFWTIIRVGSLVTVSRHTAWAKSRGEHAGGPLTRESVCRRGGGWSSVLRTLLGAANVQTSKRPNVQTQTSKHLRRLQLPTLLLTLLPCLELTIVAHQPLLQAP